MRSGPALVVASPNVYAVVDQATGLVQTFLATNAVPQTAKVSVTPDEARAAAKAWLDARGIPPGGLTATVTLDSPGDTKRYIVLWDGPAGFVKVVVNPATGQVASFSRG